MGSEQSNEFTKLLASVQERLANPNLDLPAIRDICEALASATKEPEGVTYAEVYAGSVPALWCIPEGCDNDCVLLHKVSLLTGSINLRAKLAAGLPLSARPR